MEQEARHLDTNWYIEFEKYGSFEAFNYLNGEKSAREEQKKLFLSGKSENPTLDYPALSETDFNKYEDGLLELKHSILLNEFNPVVRQVYHWKINEKIAEVRMLKTARNGDARRFRRYNEYIYGVPSREVFAYIVNGILDEASQDIHSDNQDLAQVALYVYSHLPHDLESPNFQHPTEDEMRQFLMRTISEVGALTVIDIQKEIYTASEIKEKVDDALSALEADKLGWESHINPNVSNLSVDQERKRFTIPETRQLKPAELVQKIAHEGGHVARRINGNKSKLMLLGLGLDRYEKGEEGIATAREQALSEKFSDYSGLPAQLAISLAYGLDGTPRDFREVYEIMRQYLLYIGLKSGKTYEEAEKSAQDQAWNRSVRTFRGTDCKTPGVCFMKDIVYSEGNIGVWQVIHERPNEMLRFNVGKYNPANKRHIWILEQLGITNQELTELDSQ